MRLMISSKDALRKVRMTSLDDGNDSAPARPLGPRWRSATRLVALVVLNLYAAALLIAAWPNGADFGPLRPFHTASRDLFDVLKTRSASYVFSGNRGAWKRKALCIVAIGTDSQGKQEKLYESHPDCVVPDVRLFEDTFYVLLMRIGYSSEMKRLLGASKKRREKEIRRLQTSGSLDRVSQYFCSSRLVGHGSLKDLERVDLLWSAEQIHYGTWKVKRDAIHAHAFNCVKNRRVSLPDRCFAVKARKGAPQLRDTGKCTKERT